MDMSLSKLTELVMDREAWHAADMELQRVRHNLVTEQQQQQQGRWEGNVWVKGITYAGHNSAKQIL